MNWQSIFYTSEKFVWYGFEYFSALLLLSSLGAFLIWRGTQVNQSGKEYILKGISYTLSAAIIIWAAIETYLGRFYLESDLPLIFCNLFALGLPLFAFQRTQRSFNILYFIILAGATQSIITPGLKFNFPHYEFLKFWTVHVGLIIFVVYQMVVLRMKPTKSGIWQTFAFIQIYMVIVIGINWALDANYLYLNVKPAHGTLLALLGGWPWYIVWMDIILIPYFFILYVPIWFFNKRKKHPGS